MTFTAPNSDTITPDRVRGATRPTDFVRIDTLLTDHEREVRDRVRQFVDERVIPVMPDYWDRAEFPFELLSDLGKLGLVGGYIDGYGCPGWSSVAYGLALQEIARGSGSLATFCTCKVVWR
jgi:glutaryl-CoA dehydrogenase